MKNLVKIINKIERQGLYWNYDSLHERAEICKDGKTLGSIKRYEGEGKNVEEALLAALDSMKQSKHLSTRY